MKSYSVYLRYKGKDEPKTKLGKFRCLKFEPILMSTYDFGKGSEKMTIWVTGNDNKSPLRVGWGKAYLTEYENIAHPLDAKIK